MILTCRQVAERLLEYLAGELAPELCDPIRRHLCQCPACAVYAETYELTIKLSRQLPAAPLPPQLQDWARLADARPAAPSAPRTQGPPGTA
jgi:anti-sigma factor RsiW